MFLSYFFNDSFLAVILYFKLLLLYLYFYLLFFTTIISLDYHIVAFVTVDGDR